MAGTYILLIGADTKWKYKYVRWEAEVAIEQGMRLIGVNMKGKKWLDAERCPPIFKNKGALFVPFHPGIIGFVLKGFPKKPDGDWRAKPHVAVELIDPLPPGVQRIKIGESSRLVFGGDVQRSSRPIADILTPATTGDRYLVKGWIRYANVEGDGFIVMWNHFGGKSFFGHAQ